MLNKIRESKFTSRKFILALIGDIIGVTSLISANSDGDIKAIAGIILIIASTISYIIGESKIDAISASKQVITSAEEIRELVNEILTNDDKLISTSDNNANKENIIEEVE